MRIRLSQLKRIIKEEVAKVTESPLFGASGVGMSHAAKASSSGSSSPSPSSSKLAPGKHVKVRGDDVTDYVVDKVMGDKVSLKKSKDPGSIPGKTFALKDIKEGRLHEGHARPSALELAAWKRGEWGFVAEGIMDEKYMSADDAQEYIASQDGDALAKFDVIDEDTGEVYIQAGEDFRTSPFNPDHKADVGRADRDPIYAGRAGEMTRCPDCDEVIRPGEPHTCSTESDDDYWEAQRGKRKAVEDEWHAALDEFASGWEDFTLEMPDVQPEDAAYDAAESFFHSHPASKIKAWMGALDMTKDTMKEVLADHVYEAMTKGAGRNR